jgi:hypothetical protein
MLRLAPRFLLGFLAGLALWWYATPVYNEALGRVAALILRADSRLSGIEMEARGRNAFIRSAHGSFPAAALPADQLTWNVVLFLALVATNRDLFRDRGVRSFAVASCLLVGTHLFTFVVATESLYANSPAVALPYGDLEAAVWFWIAYGYRMVGMIAAAFACWWLSAGASDARIRA